METAGRSTFTFRERIITEVTLNVCDRLYITSCGWSVLHQMSHCFQNMTTYSVTVTGNCAVCLQQLKLKSAHDFIFISMCISPDI